VRRAAVGGEEDGLVRTEEVEETPLVLSAVSISFMESAALGSTRTRMAGGGCAGTIPPLDGDAAADADAADGADVDGELRAGAGGEER